MRTSKKLFFFLSMVILLIDGLFVTANHYYTKQSFQQTLQEESQNYFAIYKTVLDATYNGLSLQATIFASDKRIQDTFLQGKNALEKEGGSKGGTDTHKIRQLLYEMVAPAWLKATQKFDVRQLHFHLGPGSLSFLRVHKPGKFGDRMDRLRYIIVDTNREQTPRFGFETGRVYSGLRSVMPVFAWDKEKQEQVYVGALEVGTSYKKLLQTIDRNLDVQLSVLLNNQHIKNTVWDEFLTGQFNNDVIENCNCIMEDSSREATRALLETTFSKLNSLPQLNKADNKIKIIEHQHKTFAIAFHPLRDYLGHKDPSRHNIGAIFIAKDISDAMAAFKQEQRFNILYGVIAYIIIELLLYLTFRKVLHNLSRQVKQQTLALQEQKKIIEQNQFKYKNLADAISPRYFFYTRNNTNQLCYVSPSIKEVLGFEPEEFLLDPMKFLPDNERSLFAIEQANLSLNEKNRHTFEVEIYNKNGRIQHLLVTETPKAISEEPFVQIDGLAQDITQSRLDKMLLKMRCKILQLAAKKQNQTRILKHLIHEIEQIIPDVHCAIMTINHDAQTMSVAAAPSLKPVMYELIQQQPVNSAIGSFVSVYKTSKRKIVKDMFQDQDWSSVREQLHNTPYKACISEPVLSDDAKLIATIDFYYQIRVYPDQYDLKVLAAAAELLNNLMGKA
jgi:PAS domain-containing protein